MALSEFPVLNSERLLLRQFVLEDASEVLAFRGDAEVQKYNAEPIASLEAAREIIEHWVRQFATGEGITWALLDVRTRRVLGSCSLAPWNTWHRSANVGYDLRRDVWGQGLAFEALRAIIDFGFGRLQLERIEANTLAVNVRSIKLLKRLGFRHEGTRRHAIREEDGSFHDDEIYGLLQSEHRARCQAGG